MRKISPRELVFVGLLFVVPLAMWLLVFQKRKAVTRNMIEDIQTKNVRLEKLNRLRIEVSSGLEDDISLLQRALEVVRTRQPHQEDTAKIIQGLSLLANSNRLRSAVEVCRQNPDPNAERQRYASRNISMEVQGAYLDFYAFLQALESQPRIIRVSQIKMGKLSGKDKDGQVKVKLMLQIFYLRAPTAAKDKSGEKGVS
jgi:Tfp pilus assembly protein PilO